MITYEEVFSAIVSALSGRPAGQKVLVAQHEIAEKKLLDFIQQFITVYSSPPAREGHITTTPEEEVFLTWKEPFESDQYSFVINAFDLEGTPAEVMIIQKTSEGLMVKTFVEADVMAIGIPY
jgi:hypothetical protein